MHCLTATRIRILLFFLFALVLWQVFRNWPDHPPTLSAASVSEGGTICKVQQEWIQLYVFITRRQ